MRLTDMLFTETPRPCLDDPPFTIFDTLVRNPTVIDGTDVCSLFMQMTINDNGQDNPSLRRDILTLEEEIGDGVGWQMAKFFHFDWSTMGCLAPPFDEFVVEIDHREAIEKALREAGLAKKPDTFVNVGRSAVVFGAWSREDWYSKIESGMGAANARKALTEFRSLPFGWMYVATVFRYVPGKGLEGPTATWLIPIDESGQVFIDPAGNEGRKPDEPLGDCPGMLHAISVGPVSSEDEDGNGRRVVFGQYSRSNQYAITQGWSAIIPALLTVSAMHTPKAKKDKPGYHEVLDGEMPPSRVQRKFLERNFRPMVRWYCLKIDGLRQALKEANGGTYPTSLEGFRQALHSVRGHTRTYLPNTYFGRKHERPITVFIPAHNRGNPKHGVVQKDYEVII